MTLGKQLIALRAARGWSQDELAARIGVSRQSVSKWETDTSTPDLDKLLVLSELFEISLDALVNGAAPAASAPRPEPAPTAPARTGGIIFLCFSFAVLLLLTLLSGALLEGLVLSVPFFICAVLCFKLRGHAGVWCTWVFVLLIEFYLRYATGIRWLWLFRGISILHTLIAGGMLLAYLLMLFVTLRAYRDLHLSLTPKRKALLTFGWILFAALYGLRWLPLSPDALMAIENLSRLLFPLRDSAPWLVLIPLSILTAGIIRTKK